VTTPVIQGGRTPDERIAWLPWGEDPPAGHHEGAAPWPGAIPAPAPAIVFRPARSAELLDGDGRPVTVSARGEMSAAPERLTSPALPRGGGPVEAWAGPWLQDLRWWDQPARRRRALWQVVAAGVACLVAVEGGEAHLEAIYD
jgi:protein ImuB